MKRGADGVNARARDGMRRQFECPNAEQDARMWRFVPGMPCPRRA